jgi:hypothetical protein
MVVENLQLGINLLDGAIPSEIGGLTQLGMHIFGYV